MDREGDKNQLTRITQEQVMPNQSKCFLNLEICLVDKRKK